LIDKIVNRFNSFNLIHGNKPCLFETGVLLNGSMFCIMTIFERLVKSGHTLAGEKSTSICRLLRTLGKNICSQQSRDIKPIEGSLKDKNVKRGCWK
jgi:hypothetical protein